MCDTYRAKSFKLYHRSCINSWMQNLLQYSDDLLWKVNPCVSHVCSFHTRYLYSLVSIHAETQSSVKKVYIKAVVPHLTDLWPLNPEQCVFATNDTGFNQQLFSLLITFSNTLLINHLVDVMTENCVKWSFRFHRVQGDIYSVFYYLRFIFQWFKIEIINKSLHFTGWYECFFSLLKLLNY